MGSEKVVENFFMEVLESPGFFVSKRVRTLITVITWCHGTCASGQALSDVSRDKPPTRTVESNTTQFMKALESVETGLLKHINYLTTVSTGFIVYSCCYSACLLIVHVLPLLPRTTVSMSCSVFKFCLIKKGKGTYSSLWINPWQSYGASPAIWDHTVLPATRHR